MKFPRIAEAVAKILADHDGNKAAAARALRTNATSISQWLSGERFPSKPKSIAAISKHSGMTVDWLAGNDIKPIAGTVEILSPAQRALWDRIQGQTDAKTEKLIAVVELFLSEGETNKRGDS